MREVQHPQIGPSRAQERGCEGEMVVVHEHDFARTRVGDDRVGELLVDREVRIPRVAEVVIETGPANVIEQTVVQEPESRVAEAVEVQAVRARVDVEDPQVEAFDRRDACLHRGAVGVAACRRDPPGVGFARQQRCQRAHHSTGTPPRPVSATGKRLERDRTSLRGDDHCVRYPRR